MSFRFSEDKEKISGRILTVLLMIHVIGYALALPLIGWKWLIFPALMAAVVPVLQRRLPGRHPYVKLWVFGAIFWTYTIHFVRYPHWINYGLMLALGGYLGVYLPLFVAVSRKLVHQRLPRLLYPVFGRHVFQAGFRTVTLLAVVTLTWAACEVLRGWVFSGIMMGSAADVFYRDPVFLQTADIYGQWGVSALLLFLSAALMVSILPFLPKKVQNWLALNPSLNPSLNPGVNQCVNSEMNPSLNPSLNPSTLQKPTGNRPTLAVPLKNSPKISSGFSPRFTLRFSLGFSPKVAWIMFLLGIIFWLGYGEYRLAEAKKTVSTPEGHIALLQGSVPAELETTPELIRKTEEGYLALVQELRTGEKTEMIRKSGGKIDLAVFPECIYRYPILFAESDALPPAGMTFSDGNPVDVETFRKWVTSASRQSQKELLNFAHYVIQAPFLTGCSTFRYFPDRVESHNSAIFVRMETENVGDSPAENGLQETGTGT
ncbi:MAG: hypothetical protein Q4C70_14935, partial [Planctomycetia bacterium]|nr:hypothetical protein [Planctomycetia bacterium]